MSKYHWANSPTEAIGEYLLDSPSLLKAARFAIGGDHDDFDGAWKRLMDWWSSFPYEIRPYVRDEHLGVYWGDIARAVIRGEGVPRKYFSEFVEDMQMQTVVINENVLAEVSGKIGGYDSDYLNVDFVTGYVNDEPIASFTFEVPERSTIAWLQEATFDVGWLYQALGILALMGFSIVRYNGKLSGSGGLIYKSGKEKAVTVWYLKGNVPPHNGEFGGDRHPEVRLLGSRRMTGYDSGFMYTGDDDWGNSWAYVYQSAYDDTVSQVNVDVFIRELNEIDPEGDDWRAGSVSGAGQPYPTMITARCYDDAGNVTAAYQKCAELLEDLEGYPLLDDDEFYKRENEYIQEQIKEILNQAQLKDGVEVTDRLVYDVQWELDEGGWQGNIDDFVLEEELVNTVLCALGVLDEEGLDPVDDFMPWGWSEQRAWKEAKWARQRAKPERQLRDIQEYYNNPFPKFSWTVNSRYAASIECFEVQYSIGPRVTDWSTVENLREIVTAAYEVVFPDPLPVDQASPDVWIAYRVRARMLDGGHTAWEPGFTYSMEQAHRESKADV